MKRLSLFTAVRRRLGWLRFPTSNAKERAVRLCICALFVALFVVNAQLLRPVLQNGDSAVYNEQIELKDLGNRATHIGYISLGIVFNSLLPFGTDLNMNVMLLTLGVIGLAAVYASAHLLSGSRLAALGSVFLALGLPSQLRGMLLSEVDVASVSLIAVAYACFLRGAPVWAGIVFGFSVLVTPLSGPTVVAFMLTISVSSAAIRDSIIRHIRKLAKFATAASCVYVPPVLAHFHDYFYGGRGVFTAPRSSFPWSQRLARSGSFIVHEAGLVLPLVVVGAVACIANARVWRTGQPAIALTVSCLVMALAGQHFLDVPVQLPNLVLLAILPAVAMTTSRWTMLLGPLAIAAVCLLRLRDSYATVLSEVAARERDRKLCVGIRAQSSPREPVLVGISGWGPTVTFGRLAGVGPTPAKVVSSRDFKRHEARWVKGSDQYVFWFFQRVAKSSLTAHFPDAPLELRRVEKRTFQVLVPRSAVERPPSASVDP